MPYRADCNRYRRRSLETETVSAAAPQQRGRPRVEGLDQALSEIGSLRGQAGEWPPGEPGPYNMARLDWFDLRTMLLVA